MPTTTSQDVGKLYGYAVLGVTGTVVGKLYGYGIFAQQGNAHRFWRVINDNAVEGGTNGFRVNELYLAARTGGPNIIANGTVLASSNAAGQGAALAIDNNPTTFWMSNTVGGLGDYIGYDFGSGNTVEIKAWSFSSQQFYVGNSVSLQYSDNGSSWTTYDSLTNLYWDSANTTTTPARVTSYKTINSDETGGYRYWRVRAIAASNSASQWYLADLGMYRAGSATNECSTVVKPVSSNSATATSTNWNYAAFDANTATFWQSNAAVSAQPWIGADLGRKVIVSTLTMTAPANANFASMPTQFSIEYSSDGIAWNTITNNGTTIYSTTWSSGQTQSFTVPNPVSRRRSIFVTS